MVPLWAENKQENGCCIAPLPAHIGRAFYICAVIYTLPLAPLSLSFTPLVIAWYRQHRRDLPWRNTRDPYVIWLSEIILQQTRVEQGMPYFYRFLERFPTVEEFAAASEDEVLNLWQGLGYYSRGRNMHFTANDVMNRFDGRFPDSYAALMTLKGVGEYTAAAISSFSTGEPRPVVDGNVFRLLARYFGVTLPIDSPNGRKEFTRLAAELLAQHDPAEFNQAIMEFGSLQCKPRNPDCGTCPLRDGCQAFGSKTVTQLPVKAKKTASRQRFFNYIVVVEHDRILVHKRTASDIWQNLYELPLLETEEAMEPSELVTSEAFREAFGSNTVIHRIDGPVVHVLSHQKIRAMFFTVSPSDCRPAARGWKFVPLAELPNLAQPKLIFAFLRKYTDIDSLN